MWPRWQRQKLKRPQTASLLISRQIGKLRALLVEMCLAQFDKLRLACCLVVEENRRLRDDSFSERFEFGFLNVSEDPDRI